MEEVEGVLSLSETYTNLEANFGIGFSNPLEGNLLLPSDAEMCLFEALERFQFEIYYEPLGICRNLFET